MFSEDSINNDKYIALEDTNTLVLSGELKASNIRFYHSEWLRISNETDIELIKIRDIDALDLTFIQLLLAIQKKCQQISITWDVNPEYTLLIKNCGFCDLLTEKNIKNG